MAVSFLSTLGKAGMAIGAGRATKRRARGSWASGLLLTAAGAAVEYFLDPQHGARRRNMVRDRTTALLRRSGRDWASKADYAAGQAKGMAHAAMPTGKSDY